MAVNRNHNKKAENSSKVQIAHILMKRDGITKAEAYDLVAECQDLIDEALERGAVWEAEDILRETLGLELDYIYAFL